jgi:hypothetical protein
VISARAFELVTRRKTVAHESGHAAAAMVLGLDLVEVRVDEPDATTAGHVQIRGAMARPCEFALATLAGPFNDCGRPPSWRPLEDGSHDERQLARVVDVLDYSRSDWDRLIADAWSLVTDREFCRLASRFETVLGRFPVLRGALLCGFVETIQKENRSAAQAASG